MKIIADVCVWTVSSYLPQMQHRAMLVFTIRGGSS